MDPLILHANHHRFRPGEALAFTRVDSRMLLWGRAGRGRVRSGGQEWDLAPGRWILLPWGHDIAYRAAPGRPWDVAGIHLAPAYPTDAPVVFTVRHRPEDSAGPVADAPLPGLEGMPHGDLGRHPALATLAEHIVARWCRPPCDPATARTLAHLLIDEVSRAWAEERNRRDLPETLVRALDASEGRLPSLAGMARRAGVAPATLVRQFRRHLGTSPHRFLVEHRLRAAADLLATTTRPVAEIAGDCGFTDPAYFSRVFRRWAGCPASVWRRRHALP
jgi:AraC-like DNA-binding protein